MSSGAYIAFTGVDGAGKSTQAGRLCQALREAGKSAFLYESKEEFAIQMMEGVAFNEEGSSAREYFGHEWVDHAKSLDVLREHLTIIRPVKESGRIIVSSRSGYCRVAVATMYGSKEATRLERLVHAAGRPDLVFYLYLPPEIAHERIERRNIDREQLETLVRLGAALDALEPRYNWVRIDASLPPDLVHQKIIERCDPLLGRRD